MIEFPGLEDQHLTRWVTCSCGWLGTTGKLIARDKLRCPECSGDEIKYVRALGTDAVN